MSDKRPLRKRIKNNIIYAILIFLLRIVKLLPRPVSLTLARFLATAGYGLAAGERSKIRANLSLAYNGQLSKKEQDEIGKRTFRNIAQNLVDALLMTSLLKKQPDKIMRIDGLENATHAKEKKKGIILLTGHTGCFEMMPPRFSLLGFPVIVLGTRIYDPRLNDLIIENRKSFNVAYVERGQGLKDIFRILQNNGGFGVLCDLDTRVESRFINFFGHPAKTPLGPFKIGVTRNIPLIPVFTVRGADGCQQVTVYPEIIPSGSNDEEKITDAMTQYNKILEALIRKDPSQWIWMHERWKSKP